MLPTMQSETPYEGGTYEVVRPVSAAAHWGDAANQSLGFAAQDIVLPTEYPFQPAKMKFIT